MERKRKEWRLKSLRVLENQVMGAREAIFSQGVVASAPPSPVFHQMLGGIASLSLSILKGYQKS